MKDEYDKELVALCPNLYRERHESPQKTCMCWGFCHNDGWYSLVKDLSIQLEALILQIPEEDRAKYCAAQVKQKLGGLRFYMDYKTSEMRELIDAAQERSFEICEDCGAPGKLLSDAWCRTACEKHGPKRKQA